MKYGITVLALALIPGAAFAADTIITFIDRGTGFIGTTLVEFLLAVALICFIWNVMRYFILGGGDEKGREKAKQLAIYSILAFVFIVILWAVINLLVHGLGFDRQTPLRPDFQQGYNN